MGTFIVSVPSFAVVARIVVGKVCPPSVESEIFTLAVSIPPPVVPLTSHVTSTLVFPVQVDAVFCVVTLNGVVVFTTVITEPASEIPPSPSRTVTLKFIVLAADGKSSPVIQVPAQIVPVAEVPVNVIGASFELLRM